MHDRDSQLIEVLEAVIARRELGEVIEDEKILGAHPDLMPELADELRALRAVEQAEVIAGGSSRDDTRSSGGAIWVRPNHDAILSDLKGYELSGEVNRGGQSVVYRAVQASTRQEVAIKVMRAGVFADALSKARFDREVYILGQFKHPNIVSIHDSGSISGSLYFVMDYIHGKPIDRYATERQMPVNDVLRLFSVVCDAVNVAHLRGVIHRDLKPGNIIVDEGGSPHVLDFGLAKVAETDDWLGGSSNLVTHTGQFIGSLPWASPEQARGRREEIDLRTDVYSLGVVLFQMLTGRFPYDVSGDIQSVLRNILDAVPQSPSQVNRGVGSEVETILLKCLSKERDRRYQSAGELKRDIESYLNGDPIEAKRDSVGYVLRKQVAKHKVPFAMIAALVVLTTVSSIWLGFLYQAAKTARAAEADQRVQAEAERAAAIASEETSRRVSDFLVNMFESSNPLAAGREVTAKELLDSGARAILHELTGQPEARAKLLFALGQAYLALSHLAEARPLLTESIDLRREGAGTEQELATVLANLAVVEQWQGNLKQAVALNEESLAIRRRVLGDNHANIGLNLCALANLCAMSGDFQKARRLFEESLEIIEAALGPRDEHVAIVLHGMGALHAGLSEFDKAEPLLREALAINRERMGDDDPGNSGMLQTLSRVLVDRRQYGEAEELLREALEIDRARLGDDHQSVAASLANLGSLRLRRGDPISARKHLLEALAIQRKRLGERSAFVADTLDSLGTAALSMKDYDEAHQHYAEALDIRLEVSGEKHVAVADLVSNIANAKMQQQDYASAAVEFRRAMNLFVEIFGEDHRRVEISRSGLGLSLTRSGDPEAAEPFLRAVLESRLARIAQEEDRLIALSRSNLGECLIGLERFEEAEPLVTESWLVIAKTDDIHSGTLRNAFKRIEMLYERWEKPERLREWSHRWAEMHKTP